MSVQTQTTPSGGETSVLITDEPLVLGALAARVVCGTAGGIEPLVTLLDQRRAVEEDVMIIAGALWNLGYNNPANQDAIREAGGVR